MPEGADWYKRSAIEIEIERGRTTRCSRQLIPAARCNDRFRPNAAVRRPETRCPPPGVTADSRLRQIIRLATFAGWEPS